MIVSAALALIALRDLVLRLRGSSLPTGEGVRAGPQNRDRMVVVGIDPGTANTGYGVVTRVGGRLVALDGGVIEASGADRGAAVRHP